MYTKTYDKRRKHQTSFNRRLSSTEGKDLVQVYRNAWWVVDKDDNVLFYRGRSPQCNSNKDVTQSFVDRGMCPDCEVRFIPVMFIPIRCGEFDYEV